MKRLLTLTFIIALLAIVFQSCNKESNDNELAKAQVEFTFSGSMLKIANEQILTNVVVTIEDLQGNVVINSEKIELYNMNGNYISKPISLLTGDYKLSRFMVLDGSNNVVYASPLAGSSKAYLVQKPLSIEFIAKKDVVTKLSSEVLSTSNSRPEDFGYATFSFDIAETFDFLVGAFVYDSISQNFELTSAEISIYSDTILVYSGTLEANTGVTMLNYDALGITNKITLPERYNTYTIIISKGGYTNYCKTFTKEELRLYFNQEDKGPLVISLNRVCDCLETVIDVEGNVYSTIKIGNQIWMMENLRTTKYNDGTSIPNAADSKEYLILTPCYYWYNNDTSNKEIYGALYNWFVINTGKLAPKGWHVPSDTEWTVLTDFLGGASIAGDKLKESGINHWISLNYGATNKFCFTGLPAGKAMYNGEFTEIGSTAYWWSSTSEISGIGRVLENSRPILFQTYSHMHRGFSVRCIKD